MRRSHRVCRFERRRDRFVEPRAQYERLEAEKVAIRARPTDRRDVFVRGVAFRTQSLSDEVSVRSFCFQTFERGSAAVLQNSLI